MRGTVVTDMAQKVTGIEGRLGFGSPQANLENIYIHTGDLLRKCSVNSQGHSALAHNGYSYSGQSSEKTCSLVLLKVETRMGTDVGGWILVYFCKISIMCL